MKTALLMAAFLFCLFRLDAQEQPSKDSDNVLKKINNCNASPLSSPSIGVWPAKKKDSMKLETGEGANGKAWKITWGEGSEGAMLFINGGKGMIPADADALCLWVKGEAQSPFPLTIQLNEGTKDQFITTVEVSETKWEKLTIPFEDFTYFWGAGGDGQLTKGDVSQVAFKSKAQGTVYIDDIAFVKTKK